MYGCKVSLTDRWVLREVAVLVYAVPYQLTRSAEPAENNKPEKKNEIGRVSWNKEKEQPKITETLFLAESAEYSVLSFFFNSFLAELFIFHHPNSLLCH